MATKTETLAHPRKHLEACQRLRQLIEERALWGQRLMGERQLADFLGVGRQTVRTTLAALEAAGLVERRHGAGTFVVERAARRRRAARAQLAVITDSSYQEEPGWTYKGEMIRAMLGWGRRLGAGCCVLALDRQESRERLWDSRYLARFDGFISVQLDDRTLLNHLLRINRGPVVLLDHMVRDLPVVGVVNANFEGARTTVRHLLALGHRRIGFVDCHNSPVNNPDRIAGFQAGLFEKGVQFDPGLVVAQPRPFSTMTPAEIGSFGEEVVGRLLGLPDPPTALFAFDDHRALPVIRAIERCGGRAGRDLCVVGYGDSAIRRGVCDWLTSCRIYPRQMGREALKAALAGGERREGRIIIVPDRLYVRGSSCPPGHSQWRPGSCAPVR